MPSLHFRRPPRAGAAHFRFRGFNEGRILSLRVCHFILRFLLSGCLRVPDAVESDDREEEVVGGCVWQVFVPGRLVHRIL